MIAFGVCLVMKAKPPGLLSPIRIHPPYRIKLMMNPFHRSDSRGVDIREEEYMTWRRRVRRTYVDVIPGAISAGGRSLWGMIKRRARDRSRWKKLVPRKLF